jgi:hypothetical protein
VKKPVSGSQKRIAEGKNTEGKITERRIKEVRITSPRMEDQRDIANEIPK